MALRPFSSPITQIPFSFCLPARLTVSPTKWRPRFLLHAIKRSSAKAPVACLSSSQHEIRPRTILPPDIWRDQFVSSPFDDDQSEFKYAEQITGLKKEVEDMLMDPAADAVDKLVLIDSICRLGVSYHFEHGIEEQLHRIFYGQPNLLEAKDYDLHTVALVFRVFRQNGYKFGCDVFERFKDGHGKFKGCLTDDPRGMLSLYEAANLSTKGETILDEALAFTKHHLKKLASVQSKPPHLANHIMDALKHPLHKGEQRLKAREYISFCEEDDHNVARNDALLKFAKLDFNRVQLLHQQELRNVKRWWKELNLHSRVPHVRDRIVEYYFWSVCLYHEPNYARAREIFVQTIYLLTFLDDTYDAYGNFEDLQIFTDAMQRWDRSAVDELPADYLKHAYNAYLDLFEELDQEATRQGRSFAVSHTKDRVKEIVRCYLIDRKWTRDGYVPTFEESLEKSAMITSGIPLMASMGFIGMGEVAGTEAFDWLQSEPEIVKAAQMISRLSNDIVTHKEEQERGFVASPFFAYMKQHNVSEMEVVEEFRKRISAAWKTVNEEFMKQPGTAPKEILKRILNFARLEEVNYTYADSFTYPNHVKDYIKALFVDQVPI